MRIRKKLRESRLRTHLQIRAWLQPKLGKAGERLRLARSHPSWRTSGPGKHPEKGLLPVFTGTLSALAGMLPCHEQ